MKSDIELLEQLASFDCGAMTDNNHDYDHCPFCAATHALNEIGEVTQRTIEYAKQAGAIDRLLVGGKDIANVIS